MKVLAALHMTLRLTRRTIAMATVIAQYKSQTELRAQNALAISTLEIESLGGGTYVPPGTENDWNENESRTA